MKAWELINMLESLPPDSKIDVLHVVADGKTRAYSVVNIHEDALGSHVIVESKRKLADDVTPRCDDCGKKLPNPNTRGEWKGKMYCDPLGMLSTCFRRAQAS